MSIFSDALKESLVTGEYFCSRCGATMIFEDEFKDILVCETCGHSVDLERYGFESDEEYESIYPTLEDIEHLFDD